MARLLLKLGGSVLKEIPVARAVITIGRKPGNDVQIDNLAVSGFHAKIVQDGGQYFIEDLNSTNGTLIAGKRVSRCVLRNNDDITVGKHTLQFLTELPAQDEASDATVRIKAQQSFNDTIVINPQQPSQHDGATAAKGRLGALTVIFGDSDKQVYELREKLITIGKAESAGIRLKGFFAPDVAALVNRVKDDYYINSAGGGKKPLVNGSIVDGRLMLREGDVIEVGKIRFQFSFVE